MWAAAVVPLAAGIAALLIVPSAIRRAANDPQGLIRPVLVTQGRGGGAALRGVTAAASIDWPAPRGIEEGPANSRALAFRAGVLLVEQDIAVDLGDTSGALRIAADRLAAILGRIPGGGAAAARIAHLRGQPADDSAARRDAQNAATGAIQTLFSDSPWFSLGIWIGQARIALAAGTPFFFRPKGPAAAALMNIRDRLESDSGARDDEVSRAVLTEVSALIAGMQGDAQSGDAARTKSIGEILRLAGGT